jgi:hypothetical protein
MENKRAAATAGAALSLGLTLLLNADRLAKFFGIVNLPQDIKHGTESRLTKRIEREDNVSSRLQQALTGLGCRVFFVQQSSFQGMALPQL